MNNSDIVYLNTSATGLLPEEFTRQANELNSSFATDASTSAMEWRETFEPKLRTKVATFLNAPEQHIALLPNFSWGMNGIVQTLTGTEKVLLYKNDYPSLTEPFIINGFDISWVDDTDGFEIDVNTLKNKIVRKEVDVVAISHVQWLSGYKLDIQEVGNLCKENNVIFIVDATQSLGAIDIDISVLGVDVFIASNYKWMNAGFGNGIMYVAPSFLERYTPAIGGHNSYQQVGEDWKYIPSVKSFEPGHISLHAFTVLYAALEHKLEYGVQNIEGHNNKLTKLLIDELEKTNATLVGPKSMNNRSSIVFLKDDNGLWQKLNEANIVAAQRGGNIRFGLHYHNTEAEIVKLVACLQKL